MTDLSRGPELLEKVVNALQEEKDYDCPVCMDQPKDFVITRCTHMCCRSCITRMFKKWKGKSSCPMCRALLTMKDIFSTQRGPSVVESSFDNMPSKVSALLIKSRSEDPSRKSVVLSQFQRTLMPVAKALSEAGLNVKRIDVIDSAKKKAIAVEEFTNADPPVILLTTLKALSNIPQGLDLSAASSSSNVYLLGLCWNVQNEREVLSRIHGYWKKEDDVKVIRLVGKNSIEERVLEFRKEKGALPESNLERIFDNLYLNSDVAVTEVNDNKLLLGLGPSYEEDFPDED